MTGPRIAIGCDHAAVPLKAEIVRRLRDGRVQLQDLGAFSGDPVDYPDLAADVAVRVASGEADSGIVLCGTGIGVSIAANKIAGIRAALCHDVTTARHTPFEGGRHSGRVEKLRSLEARAREPVKGTGR